ncbi:uncharacterized protein HMPREF1541_02279 [Cyphellophora europaea CBS 101466]|uniref:F-box domain-containing protein n=1 Tax=Cyphellophora europaea (strain CBS 101466) TaxID=1220924 RepID=W2S332_CYPE1|nr:uncharacterized protein HMPREF1541_02279 [Cyphellophora europaea CBS 101466]ETN43121.1 hypothetical protein HMPREF1541_02279 [Cyphellophora europaea CBS 101466]
MTEAPADPSRPAPTLLGLPPEIRRIIYTHLLVTADPLGIAPAPIPAPSTPPPTPTSTTSTPHPTIRPFQLSSQLLRVSRLTHTEALPILYSNTFDLASRSALHLLTHAIPASNFALITALTLDWDSLQDFSFQLAKPDFLACLRSLRTIDLSNWRSRVHAASSPFLWRDVRAYERSLCIASQAIVTKTPCLRVVAERRYAPPRMGRGALVRLQNLERAKRGRQQQQLLLAAETGSGSASAEAALARGFGFDASGIDVTETTKQGTMGQPPTTTRIKWRFLETQAQMWKEEVRVDIDAEVELLTARGSAEEEQGARQMALDPS